MGASRVSIRKNLLTPNVYYSQKTGGPFLEIIRMKWLRYDSEGLKLECIGLRDLWRTRFSLRISPALEPERLLLKESWLIVNVSQVHVMWQFLNAQKASQQGQQVCGPSLLLLSLKAEVRLWTGFLLCAQGHFQHLGSAHADAASHEWRSD